LDLARPWSDIREEIMRFSRGSWLPLALAIATLFSACTRDPQILKKRHFDKGQA
jgi:hypothetical protein